MTIAIDLTALSYHMTGVERYTSCVTEEMLKNDSENRYILIFRDKVFPVFRRFIDHKRVKAVILHGNHKYLFLLIQLPLYLYRIKADRYLFFSGTSPVLFRRRGIINTFHDMGAWDASFALTFPKKMYFRLAGIISTGVSQNIITVSEFSKGRIHDILKYPKEKIKVIYSAAYEGVTKDYGYTFDDIREKYQLPEKYILTLSTLEPRKNLQLLLRAFEKIQDQVDYDLVLVGRKGWKIDDLVAQYHAKDRIHITGYVNDEHVSVIYRNALCFVFPTLYEGFGLPPIEALTLGTPVISSDAASMPEVLRKQAVFFKSNDQSELEKLLINLGKNVDSMPHELDEFQRENYRFDVSAKKILALIDKE